SGLLFASATVLGSNPSTSAISAAKAYSSRNEPSSTSIVQSTSPPSFDSDVNSPSIVGLGSGTPFATMESEGRFEVFPSPPMRSSTRRLGLTTRVDRPIYADSVAVLVNTQPSTLTNTSTKLRTLLYTDPHFLPKLANTF
ncbi:hypothetical protein C0992_012967, partial [Termitomyces sp. T32_za158]